ncbi:MAG: acetylxylan esterase [Thermoguttaceae bacterium]|nr:acetylxylan esterase [Thermoguttaceae bacterium]MDW8077848.1 acetylxylan esterase [Thermoguttaceae bacterium]
MAKARSCGLPAMARALGVLFAVFYAGIGFSAPRPEWINLGERPGDKMLAEYFRVQVEKLAERCLAEVPTAETWPQWVARYRQQLMEMLGLYPMPPRTPLEPVVTGTTDWEDVVIEKLHFQSLPKLYVTANLYRPKEVAGKLPAILYVCGHGAVRKGDISFGNKCAYQHYGLALARRGYVCLVIDTVQLGEIEGIHHGTYRYGMWWWNNRGYTPAGIEAWNSIRAIDYLQSRPEVDPERIGISGRSGGGAYSWWTAAVDERIKAAVPVAGITDLADHVLDGCVEGHCDCMYIANTYRWDYPLVAALVAPRALLIGNTDNDDIFPEDGVRRLYEKVRKVYAALGVEDKCQLAVFPGRHEDVPQLQEVTLRWFDKHLKGTEQPVEVPLPKPLQPEQLKVFETLPAEQLNKTIHEHFIPKAAPALPSSAAEWEKWAAAWKNALVEKCFAGWPAEAPPLDFAQAYELQGEGVQLAAWDYTSEQAIRLRLYVLAPVADTLPQTVRVRVLGEDCWRELVASLRCAFAEKITQDALVDEKVQLPEPDQAGWERLTGKLRQDNVWLVAVAPRGVGPSAWNANDRKRVQIERRFMLIGQTSDGMRVWDVRRALQALRQMPALREAKVVLEGKGSAGILGLYAAIFEPDIASVELLQPPTEHRQGPYFLNVEKIFDVPQAVALVAWQTPVRLQTAHPDAWTYPREVLKLLQKTKHLTIEPGEQPSEK